MRLRENLLANPRREGPDATKRRLALLVSYDKLADLNNILGNPGQAREFALKVVKESQPLLDTDPLATELLSRGHYYLGNLTAHLGDLAGSNYHFEQGLQIWRKVRQTDPTNATAKRMMGTLYDALGDREVELRHGNEALQYYQQAHEIYAAMHKKEPHNGELQWDLANSYFRLATARRLGADLAGAAKDDREALKLRETLAKTDPNNLQRLEELMISQARCGNYRQAAGAVGDLRKRAPKDPSALIAAARCYGACIQAVQASIEAGQAKPAEAAELCRQYTNGAVECVDQAVAHGYKDAFVLEHQPDLQTLQSSAAYQKTLDKLRR
jgi:tetratricopeptide (TPR) repeat protein